MNTTPEKKSEFELTPKAKWVEMVRSGHEKYDTVEIQQALRRKSRLRSFRTTAGEPASNADVGLDAAAEKLMIAEKKSAGWDGRLF